MTGLRHFNCDSTPCSSSRSSSSHANHKAIIHDLRHSCATLLLVQGVSPRVVMEVLGHSEIALTMNAYSHVVPELQREAAQRMQAILER